MEHMEGKTSLRTVMEVAEEGGSGSNLIGKVLPGDGPGGAIIWG